MKKLKKVFLSPEKDSLLGITEDKIYVAYMYDFRPYKKIKPGHYESVVKKLLNCGLEEVKVPTLEVLERAIMDGVCETPDGCLVEPDGECPHGYKSWALIFGYL